MTEPDKLPDGREGHAINNNTQPVAFENAMLERVIETIMNRPRVFLLRKQLENELDHGLPVVLSDLLEQPGNNAESAACDLDGLATRSYEKNE